MKRTSGTRDVYNIVTDQIIAQLEKGTVPWRKPWTEAGPPQNLISKRPYKGINVWMLASAGFEQNLFLTFRQLKEIGGSVKKGEKTNIVVFTRWIEKIVKYTDEGVEKEKIQKKPFLRYYKVFNIAQCNDIPTRFFPTKHEGRNNPIEACDAIYRNMPDAPPILEEHDFAYYSGYRDFINMPFMEQFNSSESFYATLFHEMVHSTGHPQRLNRKEWIKETSYATSNLDKYSLEELVAEMGACYLESVAGIIDSQFQQNAGYIEGWFKAIEK